MPERRYSRGAISSARLELDDLPVAAVAAQRRHVGAVQHLGPAPALQRARPDPHADGAGHPQPRPPRRQRIEQGAERRRTPQVRGGTGSRCPGSPNRPRPLRPRAWRPRRHAAHAGSPRPVSSGRSRNTTSTGDDAVTEALARPRLRNRRRVVDLGLHADRRDFPVAATPRSGRSGRDPQSPTATMSPGVNRSCDAGSESRTVSRAMPDSDSARPAMRPRLGAAEHDRQLDPLGLRFLGIRRDAPPTAPAW